MTQNSQSRMRDAEAKRQVAHLARTRGVVSLVLNGVAGWVDAVGYLALLASIQMFPSFMSGNLTKIVTDAVSGNAATAAKIAGAVGMFFVGGVVGRLVNAGEARRDPASLALVAAVLGASAVNLAVGGSEYLSLVALATAMGMINHAFSGHMDFHVRTYLSGTWLALSEAVADAIAGRGEWHGSVLPLVRLSSVLIGVLAGSLSVTHAPLSVSIAVPAAIIAVVVVALLAGMADDEHDGPSSGPSGPDTADDRVGPHR